jgi:hypothetical protein
LTGNNVRWTIFHGYHKPDNISRGTNLPVSLLHRSAHANSEACLLPIKVVEVSRFIFSLSGPVLLSLFQPLRALKDKRKRGDVFDDSLCENGWRWEWMSVEHKRKCNGEVVRRERVVTFSQTFTGGSSMRGVQQTS